MNSTRRLQGRRGVRGVCAGLFRRAGTALAATAAMVALAWATPAAAQQTGTVQVTVTNLETGEPVANAQISIRETNIGGTTDAQGRYRATNVPAGTYTVYATFIGFNEARQQNVQVTSGQVTNLNVTMERSVLTLQEMIVTGTTDPTEGIKLPMTVSRVGVDQLQVPTTNSALAAMQGKVAGASIIRAGGQPGQGVYIQLRSMTGFESDSTPLLVVDGVILARSFSGTTADIESMDIESIEVIKGAAAAALYGSRAAAGVVSITTNRGRGLPQNVTRFNYRSELGREQLASTVPIAEAHHYLMNDAGTSLVNSEGRDTTWAGRTPSAIRIADRSYPGQSFDNLRNLYRPGQYLSQNFSMSQNTETTTFTTSIARLDQAGALANNKGFERTTGRLTLDHRVGERVNVSLVGTHVRSFRDNISGNPYQSILTYPAFVDLAKRDETGQFLQQPDPNVEIENPLWRQATRDNNERRARTLGSGNIRFSATNWLTFDAQLSYDRSDISEQVYVPRGTPTSVTLETTSGGQLSFFHRRTDTFNGHVGAVLRRQFGDLNLRLTTRALAEREATHWFDAEGRDLVVPGIPRLNVAEDMFNMRSFQSEIRANGFLADLAVDYRDKYILSTLIRRDGSSLFGPNERWQTYSRVAAAWRISQEDWFDVSWMNEFKVRYAMGEAGGRPGFDNQYELWNVTRTGGISRNNAGNPDLRPQFTREQEVGLDVIAFNNRVSVELVYAWQTSRDQIIFLPAITMSGFNSVRGNGATIEGNTIEATVQAWPIRSRNLTWNMSMVLDRSRNEIASWDRACFFGSNAGRTHEYTCAGASAGDFWISSLTRSADELPSWLQGRADEFQVNDEGYMVWVGRDRETGEPLSWRDGLSDRCRTTGNGACWGTTTVENGVQFFWGEPFAIRDEEALIDLQYRGSALPDLNFGFTNNVTYRGFSVYTAFRGQIGGKVYNNVRQWQYAQLRHGDYDQRGKPEELQKTIDYYQRGRYNANRWTDDFLEDGTHIKLGELAVRYRFNEGQLQRVLGNFAPSNLGVGLNGRNLFTITNYSGFDPEAGTQFSRVESINYPHLRSFTATFDITF
jgi:TonB-linked SusC/RagA family outer membrane protein